MIGSQYNFISTSKVSTCYVLEIFRNLEVKSLYKKQEFPFLVSACPSEGLRKFCPCLSRKFKTFTSHPLL
jgi:hypothetical protein